MSVNGTNSQETLTGLRADLAQYADFDAESDPEAGRLATEARDLAAGALAPNRAETRIALESEREVLVPKLDPAQSAVEAAGEPLRRLMAERAAMLRRFGPEAVLGPLNGEIHQAEVTYRTAQEKLTQIRNRLETVDRELRNLDVVTSLPPGASEDLRQRQRTLDLEARDLLDENQLAEQLAAGQRALDLFEKARTAAEAARQAQFESDLDRLGSELESARADLARAEANQLRETEALADAQTEIDALQKRFPAARPAQIIPRPLAEAKMKAEDMLRRIAQSLRQARARVDTLTAQIEALRGRKAA